MIMTVAVQAQQNKIKLGFIGLPFNGSGVAIGTAGYERFDQKLNASWQLSLSAAGGNFAADAPIHSRTWITGERSFYFKPVAKKKIGYSFSPFIEIGTRSTRPGHAAFGPDSILKKRVAFEINPGAGLGLYYALSKNWGIEMQAGPKLIFARKKEYFTNSIIHSDFETTDHEIRAGFMLTGCVYFQF
jgi:hypothetical protein